MMEEYIGKKVTKGTARSYQAGWKRWVDHINGITPANRSPGVYLEKLHSVVDKVDRVVLFLRHLYYEEGKRGDQLGRDLTCMSHMMVSHQCDVGFLKDARITAAKAAGLMSTEETREHVKKQMEEVKVPVTEEMVREARLRCWKDGDWTKEGLDKKATYLGVALGFDAGPRIGNLTLRDGRLSEDHCMRASDVAFQVIDPATSRIRRLPGGPLMAEFLARDDVRWRNHVLLVDVHYITFKTVRKKKVVVQTPKTIERRSEAESELLDDVCEWVIHSGVQSSDEFLTRYCPTRPYPDLSRRKVLVRKDVASLLKDVGEHFKIPRKNVSTKSMRSGFATVATVHKVCREERNAQGGWTRESSVPDRHYAKPMHNRGAFALMGQPVEDGDRVGMLELQRMLPAEAP
jgi:hypothetical protein